MLLGIFTFLLLVSEGETFEQTVITKIVGAVLFVLTAFLCHKWKNELLNSHAQED